MNRKTFVLVHRIARERAADYVRNDAPEGFVVVIEEAKKKRIQEEKYHAQIDDIAEQGTYAGQQWKPSDMKRILIDEFADEMRKLGEPLHEDADSRLIPSENGKRIIQLGIQSRNFYVSEARDFITFLNKWADDRSIVFSNETRHKLEAAS
jgi:hypothetical protein